MPCTLLTLGYADKLSPLTEFYLATISGYPNLLSYGRSADLSWSIEFVNLKKVENGHPSLKFLVFNICLSRYLQMLLDFTLSNLNKSLKLSPKLGFSFSRSH